MREHVQKRKDKCDSTSIAVAAAAERILTKF